MYKVNIKHIKSDIVWSGNFDTLGQAESWLAKQKKKERRRDIREIQASSGQFDEADILSERFEELEGMQIRYVTLKAEATYLIEDITVQEQARKESEEALQYLKESDWYVLRSIDPSNGTPVPQEVLTLRAAARLKVI